MASLQLNRLSDMIDKYRRVERSKLHRSKSGSRSNPLGARFPESRILYFLSRRHIERLKFFAADRELRLAKCPKIGFNQSARYKLTSSSTWEAGPTKDSGTMWFLVDFGLRRLVDKFGAELTRRRVSSRLPSMIVPKFVISYGLNFSSRLLKNQIWASYSYSREKLKKLTGSLW